ncbi:MAG: sialate O-acetylesterase [Roseburia sp.]|nr:sialate O-acetylesterase [Roseburia sp.]MCM1097935.1 sialate O-acetylesterase [Ruminococcus flavefaciens]
MELKLAAIFSDNCVLQRNRNIIVFGTGEEGKTVEAVLSGRKLGSSVEQMARGRGVVKDGRFEILLSSLKAGVEHTLTVTDGTQQVVRRNIAIGEVWLAGGQSNMAFELKDCAESRVLKKPSNSMLRFYNIPRQAYQDEAFFRAEEESSWECFGGPGTEHWSAVGYFFAAKLYASVRVPIGIIGCNWGGSPAAAWVPEDLLAGDRELKIYVDQYEEAVAGKSVEDQLREYQEYEVYQKKFDKRVASCYARKPDMDWEEVLKYAGENRWPGPMCCKNPFRPGGLYQCMLRRIIPYTLKGFLYYQGESDENRPHLYRKLLAGLIGRWREDWGDDRLPFLFVQLPMFKYRKDPDYKNWCLIREAQNRVQDTVNYTAMTCIIDLGELNELHPKRKKEVGERMSAQALKLAYGMKDVPDAVFPQLDYADILDGEIVLRIRGAGDGLCVHRPVRPEIIPPSRRMFINQPPKKKEEPLPPADKLGFEIAGEDGRYVAAKAQIEGDKIILSGRGVKSPRYARYLWTNYGEVFVYGKNGLPLAPFRTSREDGFQFPEG